MDRELLIEIGRRRDSGELAAGLTTQLAAKLEARLKELRLPPAAPIETFSTPRRLTARIAKLAERQTDFEEILNGPPVSAAFNAAGEPTPAADGFAKRHGVEVSALERLETPKGTYLALRKQHRGKAAVDVLPDVLAGLLRELAFPKPMRWDAMLDDGKGELPFGRPIRWILFLYGGRVVPFSIYRTPLAQGPLVQEIRSGAVTFGHRFLDDERPRRPRDQSQRRSTTIRKRLAENFVVLERTERQERVARELEGEARRRGGRVSRQAGGQALLQEVPDLVEYPKVISGAFPDEFLSLPEEVLTTTMIHHQHFFPVVNDQGKLLPVFLAVLNMEGDRPELIARNLERVLTARLRDARFFWDADREQPARDARRALGHGPFSQDARQLCRESRAHQPNCRSSWPATCCRSGGNRASARRRASGQGRPGDRHGARDDRVAGAMGGIYAREDGLPEEVWKAIYYPLSAGRRGSGCAADAGAIGRRNRDMGRRLPG